MARKLRKDAKFARMIQSCEILLWNRFGIGPSETREMSSGQILRLARVLLAQG